MLLKSTFLKSRIWMQIFWLLFFPLYLPPFSTLCSAAQPNLNTGGDPTASPGSCCTEPYQTVLLLLAEASPRLSAAGPGSGGHQAPPHSFRTPRCPVRGSSTLHCSCVQCLTGLVPVAAALDVSCKAWAATRQRAALPRAGTITAALTGANTRGNCFQGLHL